MPPRRRPTFTAESVDQQLQQIHLLDQSSPTENLEQLGPIIQQIYTARHQDAYLRTLKTLVEAKESEIEQICGENYQDFVSSTSTLLTVRQYTHNLQDKITTLDGSVTSMGKALLTRKQELLQLKTTGSNLDEAIDSLQACLRVLDVVNRVGELIQEGKFWSALRSLEEIKGMVPTSLSQTPFFSHLLSSVPSLRNQIKDAVTASNKSWLLHIRNVSRQVGKLALENMDARRRRWKSKQERDPFLRSSRVGSAVEVTSNEGKEADVLDNEKLKVDFKPLYQCIHIYTALDSLDELQRSYHADRKAQSVLILPSSLTLPSLPSLTEEIAGFFIIESHVMRTTRGFRVERDVEELWEEAIRRVKESIQDALRQEKDHEMFIVVKDCLLGFAMTMEGYGFSVQSLHAAILVLLEQYVKLLQWQSGKLFENGVNLDELVPMPLKDGEQRAAILKEVWLSPQFAEELSDKSDAPWSTSFYDCCKEIRQFATEFYKFVDGVVQHNRFVDEILGKGLDLTLITHVCQPFADRLSKLSAQSQIAQVISNLECLQMAIPEIETSLSALRPQGRGDIVPLEKFAFTVKQVLSASLARIATIIRSKLVDFFELSEYDWTPRSREATPSMYLYELVNWLTTVVDSLKLRNALKDEVYRVSIAYVAESMMDFITNAELSSLNESALANLLVDVAFLENHIQEIGRDELVDAFTELRNTITIILENRVPEYMNSSRQSNPVPVYANVRPDRLAAILDKLARFSADPKNKKDPVERDLAERRRREAEAVSRILNGHH